MGDDRVIEAAGARDAGVKAICVCCTVTRVLQALTARCRCGRGQHAGEGGGYLPKPRIAHNEALAAAGVPHVTLHGSRRSFSTLAKWVDVPLGIVAQEADAYGEQGRPTLAVINGGRVAG